MKIFNMKQRSPEWFELRRGVITGTSLKGLMGRTKMEWIYKLVAERITVEDPEESMMGGLSPKKLSNLPSNENF